METPSPYRYMVSNHGRVRMMKVRTWRVVSQYPHEGYWIVQIRVEGIRKRVRVHRLVARAFVENLMNLPHVNHKNMLRYDNVVTNLEWVTPAENDAHARRSGVYRDGRTAERRSESVYRKTWPGPVARGERRLAVA